MDNAEDWSRLEAYLKEHLKGLSGRLRGSLIPGGQSNPTFILDSEGGTRFVLRKQPPGPLLPSAHAIDREFRVIRALETSAVPVPRALHYCEDRSIFGTPFYVMEWLNGRVFHDNSLPGVSPAERRQMYRSMGDVLARLHTIEPEAVGLADFGRPGNFFQRQIKRWTQQHEATRTAEIPALEALAGWLPLNIPEDETVAIVHGDYRVGNLMFHPSEPRVIGVLDWELSTLGHPMADLGYNATIWHNRPDQFGGLGGLDLDALGIPSLAEYVDEYGRATGRPGQMQPFHVAFSYFRVAVIFEGIAARAAQGNAVDAKAKDYGRFISHFAQHGCDSAGLGG